MLELTNYSITADQIEQATNTVPQFESKLTLNKPTGSFFTEPWTINTEFKGTIWEQILDSIKEDKGEARLIRLTPGECYLSHADVDDRWHLSLTGKYSYLIDLDHNQMFQSDQLGCWYSMDAGLRHTAVNFGPIDRLQVVVRKLLPTTPIDDPKDIRIKLKMPNPDYRFVFDDIVSPWMNRAFKADVARNFVVNDLDISLTVKESIIPELANLTKEHFIIEMI